MRNCFCRLILVSSLIHKIEPFFKSRLLQFTPFRCRKLNGDVMIVCSSGRSRSTHSGVRRVAYQSRHPAASSPVVLAAIARQSLLRHRRSRQLRPIIRRRQSR